MKKWNIEELVAKGNNVVSVNRVMDLEDVTFEYFFDADDDDFIHVDYLMVEEMKAELLETSVEDLPYGVSEMSRNDLKIEQFRLEVRGDILYCGTTRYLDKMNWLPDEYINAMFEEIEKAEETMAVKKYPAYLAHI